MDLRMQRYVACAYLRGIWDLLPFAVRQLIETIELAAHCEIVMDSSWASGVVYAERLRTVSTQEAWVYSEAWRRDCKDAGDAVMALLGESRRADKPNPYIVKQLVSRIHKRAQEESGQFEKVPYVGWIEPCLRSIASSFPQLYSGLGSEFVEEVTWQLIMAAAREPSDTTAYLALADRLEEVEQFSAKARQEMVNHLRQATRHFRGCWVLDQLRRIR